MHPSDRTPEHSASPSPELCGLLSGDKDVEMIDSEAESQEPAAGSAHARSAPLRLGVAQATVHGRLNELDTQHNFNSDEEGGEGQGQGQVEEDEEDKEGQLDIPREPRSRSRSRLDGDSKPSSRPVTTPAAHAPLGNERSVPSSIPKIKIEYDRDLNKEANRRLDQSSLVDRHRCTAESLADSKSDELSTGADAHGERDRAGEISMDLVMDTEAATVEFLFPSRGDDAASGYSDACKLRVTTKGSGSVSLSASWRVG